MEHTITITKRASDYHAHIDDDRRFWGCGRTPHEALGNAIWTHADKLGLDIDDQTAEPFTARAESAPKGAA